MPSPISSPSIPENPKAVVFVNGIIARNGAGMRWMWKNSFALRAALSTAEGCIQIKGGIAGPREMIMVSYWQDEESLHAFYISEYHKSLVRYVIKNPDNLSLYNETYSPKRPGKYSGEPNGMLLAYPPKDPRNPR
jgi:heme-degrading monooxygenase HmoA